MSSTIAVDLDHVACVGVREGKSWAVGCTPRELYLLARFCEQIADASPVHLATVVYPDLPERDAVRFLWRGRWPVALPIERSEAGDAFIKGFVAGAMEVWQAMFNRFTGPKPRPQPTIESPADETPSNIDRRGTTPVKSVNLETGEIRRYPSSYSTIRDGHNPSSVMKCLRGTQEVHHGLIWRRDEQPSGT